MNDIQLKERIKSLSFSTIINMSHDGLAVLTNKFQEPLVRELMYSATTNSRQRVLFKYLKEAYKKWMKENEPMWGGLFGERYPEYMDKMQLDIECGMIVTKDGAVPDPAPDKAPADTTTHVLNTISSAFGLSSRTPSPETSNTTNLRIRALEQKNRELEAIIAHKNAELEQRIEEYMEEHTMTEEDIDAMFRNDNPNGHSNATNEEVEALKKRVRELEEELSKRNECENGDIPDLDDIQRLAIDERIIFFSSALGVSLDPQYISQKKMAALISKLSGDHPESIRTRIVALNREEKMVNENENRCYSQSTKEAADNVYEYVASVSKSDSARTNAMKNLMENIDLVYELNKENKD